MKKLLCYIVVMTMVSSCAPTQSNLTTYQSKNIAKFGRKKNHRAISGPRSVSPRKRGDYRHPAVTRSTFKYIKQTQQ